MASVPRSRHVALTLATACLFLAAHSTAAQSAQQGSAPPPPAQQSPAQQPSVPLSQSAPITSDTKLVTMLAAVRDKKGNFVRNLTKDDFSLQQDGHPQTITYFVQDPHAPLVIGLLVDTSLSQRHVLDQERGASGEFLDRMFDFADTQSAAAQPATSAQPASAQPAKPTTSAAANAPSPSAVDKAFIVRFDFEVELMQDVTPNREKLETALRAIDTPEFTGSQPNSSSDPNDPDNSNNRGQGANHHRGGRGAGTLLYDAIYLSAEDITRKQEGRKALVILTDGDDRGSKESLENAIESAQRSDTVVYSILFRDEDEYNSAGRGGGMHGGYGGGGGHRGGGGYPQQEQRPDGKKVLERISKETGGKFFEVTKKQSIGDIYAAINDELRSQYSIAYKPEPTDAGPGYHKIQLSAKTKDLSVQTREGYYAK
jgi:VWFA-related protein